MLVFLRRAIGGNAPAEASCGFWHPHASSDGRVYCECVDAFHREGAAVPINA
jgi:hypothetical protein